MSGCTAKPPATVSPDSGALLAFLKQAAADEGFAVTDGYKAGTGEKLPNVLGGFTMTRIAGDSTVSISIFKSVSR